MSKLARAATPAATQQAPPPAAPGPGEIPDPKTGPDPGQEPSGRVGLADVAAAGAELGKTHRVQLVPWGLAAATATAAAVVQLVAAVTDPWWPALLMLTATLTATGWAGLLGARRAGGITAAGTYPAVRVWRAYAVAGAVLSAGWQLAAAIAGPSTGLVVALVAVTGVAGVPWWRRHAAPDPDVAAEAAVVPAAEPAPAGPDRRVELYDTYLAAAGKPLPETTLSGLEPIPYGWAGTLTWPQGRTHDELTNGGEGEKAKRVLRSIYKLPRPQLSVDTLSGDPPDKARLMVLTQNPLGVVTDWSGPTLAEGEIIIGVYADGAPVRWQFFHPQNGARHGLICGCSGSGKSRLQALILVEALLADWIQPWLLDGQGGASNPRLVHYVARAGRGAGESLTRLREAEAILDGRSGRMPDMTWVDSKGRTHTGVSQIVPSRAMPQLVIILDEPRTVLADDEAVRIVSRLAAEGRKAAISVIMAAQQPSSMDLNWTTGARDQFKSGNIVLLRTNESVTANMTGVAPGTLDPPPEAMSETFPDGTHTFGVGYKPEDRRAMMRTHRLAEEDEQDWATQTVNTPLEAQAATTGQGQPARSAARAAVQPHTAAGTATSTSGSQDGLQQVTDAIGSGTPPDPVSIQLATGLAPSQVRAALRFLGAGGPGGEGA